MKHQHQSTCYLNKVKDDLTSQLERKSYEITNAEINDKLKNEKVDVTLPIRPYQQGKIHPVSQVIDEISSIFSANMEGHEKIASSISRLCFSAVLVSISAFLFWAVLYEAPSSAHLVSFFVTDAVSIFAAGLHPKTEIKGSKKM